MRFYFEPGQTDVLKKLTINMANARFYYGFEYLGAQVCELNVSNIYCILLIGGINFWDVCKFLCFKNLLILVFFVFAFCCKSVYFLTLQIGVISDVINSFNLIVQLQI